MPTTGACAGGRIVGLAKHYLRLLTLPLLEFDPERIDV
jgi:hypothetical protein